MTTDPDGGIWTYTLDLGRELVHKTVLVKLAVLGAQIDDEKRRAAAEAGVDIVVMDARLSAGGDTAEANRTGDALASLASQDSVDIVHLNHPALAAGARFDAPVLIGCHSCVATWWDAVKGTPLPDTERWQAERVGQGYRAARALVAPSRAFAEATKRLYDLDQLPHVVHNGRAPDPLPTTPAAPAEAVLTVGRLWDEAKNVKTLDRIAALTTAPFRAAGPVDGPDGHRVAPTHLELLGPLSEAAMREQFARRPIYLSAALFEPFGLAILEAAQAGCALVLSDIDALRELWTDAALFVAPEDEEGFAAAAGRLLSDPDLRADYAHAAQNRARAFALDAFADDMFNLYREILGDAKAVAAA